MKTWNELSREAFIARLRAQLRRLDVELVTASPGSKGRQAVWLVSVQLPSRRVQLFSCLLPEGVQGFSRKARRLVVDAVRKGATSTTG